MSKTTFTVRTYEVGKSRTGHEGVWDSWKYQAREKGKKLSVGDRFPRPLGASEIYDSLDSLADELVKFPEIEVAEFVPASIVKKSPLVSLCDKSLTQWATVTDEELGQLASLVQKRFYDPRR